MAKYFGDYIHNNEVVFGTYNEGDTDIRTRIPVDELRVTPTTLVALVKAYPKHIHNLFANLFYDHRLVLN